MARRLPQKIDSGSLRHRIQIVQGTGSQDSMGGTSAGAPTEFSIVWTCWASIDALVGDDTLAAEEFVSTTTHWIVIRNPRSTFQPTAAMFVWFNGRTFEIKAVLNPTEQNIMLVLVCVEINNSQQQAATPLAS